MSERLRGGEHEDIRVEGLNAGPNVVRVRAKSFRSPVSNFTFLVDLQDAGGGDVAAGMSGSVPEVGMKRD
jgi:hypothetical protein